MSIGSHGYAQVFWKEEGDHAVGTTAQRVAWVAVHGPIPGQLTVDHVCHNRVCCNPRHLRLLTLKENARDNGQGAKTHCPQGHEYTPENTRRRPDGARVCRRCNRERVRRYRQMQSELTS